MKDYNGPQRDVLIYVGTKDDFLDNQLQPKEFAKAAAGTKISVDLRLQVGSTFCVYSLLLARMAFYRGSQTSVKGWSTTSGTNSVFRPVLLRRMDTITATSSSLHLWMTMSLMLQML